MLIHLRTYYVHSIGNKFYLYQDIFFKKIHTKIFNPTKTNFFLDRKIVFPQRPIQEFDAFKNFLFLYIILRSTPPLLLKLFMCFRFNIPKILVLQYLFSLSL